MSNTVAEVLDVNKKKAALRYFAQFLRLLGEATLHLYEQNMINCFHHLIEHKRCTKPNLVVCRPQIGCKSRHKSVQSRSQPIPEPRKQTLQSLQSE